MGVAEAQAPPVQQIDRFNICLKFRERGKNMDRRDIARVLVGSVAGGVILGERAEAQSCVAPCYAQTAAEVAAGVTPANYGYAPGDVRRYGADINSPANGPAFQAAVKQFGTGGAAGYIPSGTWQVSTTVTGARGMLWYGDGRFNSIVNYTGSGNWYTYTGTLGDPDGGSHEFRDFTLKGSSSAGNLIELTTAGQNTFVGMRFWLSGASLVVLQSGCHNTHFRNCQFRSWKTGAIYCTGLNSIVSVVDCEFSILGGDAIPPAAGSSCVFLDTGEQIALSENNVNGDGTLYHFIRVVGAIGRLYIGENYGEGIVGPNTKTDSGCAIAGAIIQNNQVSCTDSVAYDFSAGNPAHSGLVIRNIRRPETGAVYIFNPGSGVVDFDYSGTPLNGSADHVVGFAGIRSVRKYIGGRIDRNGQMASVKGISATTTPANNLRGNSNFSAATTKTITFATNEADANFFVQVTFTSDPGASVTRLWVSDKSATGFRVNANAATSAFFDWQVFR